MAAVNPPGFTPELQEPPVMNDSERGGEPRSIRLQGRDIYTADNQYVGIVRDMVKDRQTGFRTLIVSTSPTGAALLAIPFEDVGVISQSRVMLDVTTKELERGSGDRYRWVVSDLD
jgi:sporulation protein YlmC with PRC-barrel domain